MKKVLISVLLSTIGLLFSSSTIKPTIEREYVTVSIDKLELNKDNFFLVCKIYDIKFPEIVYAQARLESGNFKSKLFQTKNNFLGLYNSRIKDFYEFDHWTDCLLGYRDLLQFKYNGDDNQETYYKFLKDLPYAMDPEYIQKVRRIAKSTQIKI